MTEAEAQVLTAKLAAAFPRDWSFAGKLTNGVYVERLKRFPSYPAATDAIDVLIDNETRLPTIGKIREEYGRHLGRYALPQIEEPPISEADRQENLARIRKLAADILDPVYPEGQD